MLLTYSSLAAMLMISLATMSLVISAVTSRCVMSVSSPPWARILSKS